MGSRRCLRVEIIGYMGKLESFSEGMLDRTPKSWENG